MKVMSATMALVASGCLATAGVAQVNTATDRAGAGGARTTQGEQGDRLNAPAVRGSELLGLNVENPQGESIGEIQDLVMNAENGKTAYVAMSVGGILGLGDEMFAIPYDAFAIRGADRDERADATSGQDRQSGAVADDLGDFVAVLDVNEDTFEDAEGFDQDNWPDMASREWREQNDRAYQQARESREKLRMQDRDYQATAQQRRQEAERDRQRMKTYATYRASELVGLNFDVAQADEQAEVQDVVLDARSGKIKYVAVTFNDNHYALPPDALQVTKTSDDELKISMSGGQQWFDSNQPFNEDQWPGNVSSARRQNRAGNAAIAR